MAQHAPLACGRAALYALTAAERSVVEDTAPSPSASSARLAAIRSARRMATKAQPKYRDGTTVLSGFSLYGSAPPTLSRVDAAVAAGELVERSTSGALAAGAEARRAAGAALEEARLCRRCCEALAEQNARLAERVVVAEASSASAHALLAALAPRVAAAEGKAQLAAAEAAAAAETKAVALVAAVREEMRAAQAAADAREAALATHAAEQQHGLELMLGRLEALSAEVGRTRELKHQMGLDK